ncbi:hypothetical protein OEZ60_13710 [Defluviimonas sp. WL0024]|uniref:Uncharacterized protein n=1 Tax=Albidovulum salinarum TaxID=2984153 RepID=A0ABT2X553_9RHOB|nr:hypothetical protein [Defluviimonas sp. WL0024]MCU9849059.1 hypothetical protein [Defluviimonas sp. WL0024]
MRLTAATTILIVTSAVAAAAASRIDELCGPNHENEIAGAGDVRENPAGFYVESLGVQLDHGDLRIVRAVGSEYHLCTRPAATPDMNAGRARLLMEEREVKYLFVPAFAGEATHG